MSLPLIPDKSYKFSIYIGLGLIIFSCSEFSKNRNKIDNNFNEIYYYQDEIEREMIYFEHYSKKNKESNSNLIDSFKKKLINLDIKIKRNKNLIENNNSKELLGLFIVGSILVLTGLYLWESREKDEFNIVKRQNVNLPIISECCQSCGLDFNSMVKYGTEINTDIKNYNFCIDCFENGLFKFTSLNRLKYKKIKSLFSIDKNKYYIRIYMYMYLKALKKLERWK
jgi:hypothetical protein